MTLQTLTLTLRDPRSGTTPECGCGAAMLVVGVFCLHQAHFRRTMLLNGHFGRISSTLYFTVFQSLGGHASVRHVSHKPCFRQAHCFMHGRFSLCPQFPHAHIWSFPITPTNGIFMRYCGNPCERDPTPQQISKAFNSSKLP